MGMSRRTGTVAAVFTTVLATALATQPPASAAPVAPRTLPACQHFYTGTDPGPAVYRRGGPSPEIGAGQRQQPAARARRGQRRV